MDFAALKNLIDSEPANAARSDSEIAAWLNELVAGPPAPITSATLLKWAAKYGIRARMKAAIASPMEGVPADIAAQIRSICDDALLMLQRDSTVLDIADPDIQTMLGALVQAGVITSGQVATLTALAATTRRRCESCGFTREVDFGDVQMAKEPS